MAEHSNIEWTDSTFNPWEGCQKVSPGCDLCYAEKRNARFGGGQAPNWGPGAPRRRTSPSNWAKPLLWEREHEAFMLAHGRRRRVFCASLADVFDNEVDPAWRADLFDLIANTPHLDWLLLTKRIGNAWKAMADAVGVSMASLKLPLPNVWLGATVVNQEEADRDIPKLLAVPARVRFLSIEPMLGPVDLTDITLRRGSGDEEHFDALTFDGDADDEPDLGTATLDWVICGGESGPGGRPMHPDWPRSLRDQCAAAGVPYLFKQHGEWREPQEGERFDTTMGRAQTVPAFIVAPTGTVHCFENDQTRAGGKAVIRVGKKAAGRLLDGIEHNGFPA